MALQDHASRKVGSIFIGLPNQGYLLPCVMSASSHTATRARVGIDCHAYIIVADKTLVSSIEGKESPFVFVLRSSRLYANNQEFAQFIPSKLTS